MSCLKLVRTTTKLVSRHSFSSPF